MRAIWIAVVILLVLAGIWYFGGYNYEPRQAQIPPPPSNENMAQSQQQPAPPEQPATGMREQQQPMQGSRQQAAEQGPSGTETAQSGAQAPLAGGDLTGKTVFSKDGRVLGLVSDLRRGSQGKITYVIVKGDQDRLHPVPADLLSHSPQGDRLDASFDENTFKNAPSFSAEEEQQISEAQLDQVRGYYEGQGGASGHEPSSGPQDKGITGSPETPSAQPSQSQ